MRFLLWLIAIFALAAAVAMLAGGNEGYVLLVVPPWRAQVSLNLVIVALLLGFVSGYFVLRLLSNALDLPGRVGAYRARRQQQKAFTAFKGAVRALFEGRYSASVKHAKQAYAVDAGSPVAALVAARAAHALHDDKHYREWLEKAGQDSEGKVAGLLTEIEFALDTQRTDDAAAALVRLQETGHRSNTALRLALRLAKARERWDEVVVLIGQLAENKAMTPQAARPLLQRAYLARLRALARDPQAQATYWKGLPKEEGAQAEFLAQAVPLLALAQQGGLARKQVERALENEWHGELAAQYHLTVGREEDAPECLSRAEKWLNAHPRDAGLLYSLGRQCAAAHIWGKAQSYLEASLAVESLARTHCALARLLEELERPDEARLQYRLAAGCPA